MTAISPEFRRKLIEERDQARGDTRLKARFMSYRLNVPSADEAAILLTVDDWKLVTARPVGLPAGRPIVGVDLGGGRAWSAAVAVWQSRAEWKLSLARRESPTWTHRSDAITSPSRRLPNWHAANGSLSTAQGLRVQPPSALWEAICDRWGVPCQDRVRPLQALRAA